MHPILIHFGKISIYTYGLFAALGFLAGIGYATREARRIGVDQEKIMDLGFYILIAAIVGSRLAYVATMPAEFAADPVAIFKIWKGGLVFYGGFAGALLTALVYLKVKGMPVWQTGDIVAPSIALGHFLGRIGCFFAGCCYGSQCQMPWAVTFNDPESLAPLGIPLHPTQLYSAGSNLTIFLILVALRRHRKFDGQIFWLYVLLYGAARSIIEIFRGDFRGATVMGVLSPSQAMGGVMILLAIVMLIILAPKTARQNSRT